MTDHRNRLRAIVNQDGAAILEIKSGRISTLNATGATIWQALERGESVDIITEDLARSTGEGIEIVRKDVVNFIQMLKKQDLLPG